MASDRTEKTNLKTSVSLERDAQARFQNQELPGSEAVHVIRKLWPIITSDSSLTLFGFQRFRTAHLLNLRLLESEIRTLNHKLYQAGLNLNEHAIGEERLGVKYEERGVETESPTKVITEDLVLKLRDLLKQYGMAKPMTTLIYRLSSIPIDEALVSFNQLMLMETYSSADNPAQPCLRSDIDFYERYKTRLLRADLPRCNGSRDVLQHYFRKGLRMLWFFMCSGGINNNAQSSVLPNSKVDIESTSDRRSSQNTAQLADFLSRIVVAVLAGMFLVTPLNLLSRQTDNGTQLALVSIFIVIFAFLLSLVSKASHQETMAASAAYAAVLVVFIANSPTLSNSVQ